MTCSGRFRSFRSGCAYKCFWWSTGRCVLKIGSTLRQELVNRDRVRLSSRPLHSDAAVRVGMLHITSQASSKIRSWKECIAHGHSISLPQQRRSYMKQTRPSDWLSQKAVYRNYSTSVLCHASLHMTGRYRSATPRYRVYMATLLYGLDVSVFARRATSC